MICFRVASKDVLRSPLIYDPGNSPGFKGVTIVFATFNVLYAALSSVEAMLVEPLLRTWKSALI